MPWVYQFPVTVCRVVLFYEPLIGVRVADPRGLRPFLCSYLRMMVPAAFRFRFSVQLGFDRFQFPHKHDLPSQYRAHPREAKKGYPELSDHLRRKYPKWKPC